MTSSTRPTAKPSSSGRTAFAVGVLFFVNGATFSNWLPRIPEVRDRLGVSNAGLGAALIGGGLGGLVMSVAAGGLLTRFGSRRCLVVAASGLALALPCIALAPSALALAAVLTVLGGLDVVNDLAMNAQGVMVQHRVGRSIMQRLHGGWSLGFLVGAGIGSVAGATRLPIKVHLVVIAAVLLAAVQRVRPMLLAADDPANPAAEHASDAAAGVGVGVGVGASSARRRLPSARVLAMAGMALGVGFIEFIPNDWSAVLLHDVFSAGRLTGAGALVYAASMLAGRLVGDHALERLGAGRLLDGAFAVAAAGVAVVVVAPSWFVVVGGFALWGLGASVLFPQLYTMAATLPGTSAGAGLGAMAVGQRFGAMAEAASVGALADASGLRRGIAVVGVAGFLLALGARRVVADHASLRHRGR